MWPVNYANPIELNRYAYVAGNPVNATDPTGLAALFEAVGRMSKALGTIANNPAQFGVGAVYASIGYVIAVNVYAAMRLSGDISLEIALETVCKSNEQRIRICSNNRKLVEEVLSFEPHLRFREHLIYVWDDIEFGIALLIERILNQFNTGFLSNFTLNYIKLTHSAQQLAAQEMRGGLLFLGAAASLGVGASTTLAYGTSSWEVTMTSIATAMFWGATANTVAFDDVLTIRNNSIRIIVNIAAWKLATSFTRFGSGDNDLAIRIFERATDLL